MLNWIAGMVLLLVKTDSPTASQQLARLCGGLSAGAEQPRVRSFWHVAGGFFEAINQKRLPQDVYVKRAASRILLQFAGLAKAKTGAERMKAATAKASGTLKIVSPDGGMLT